LAGAQGSWSQGLNSNGSPEEVYEFSKMQWQPLAGMGFCKSTDCLRVDFSDNRHIVRLENR
jgi:hypothetical protein